MRSQQTLPRTENIPALSINIEGLKRHSVLCVFVPEPELSADELKLRGWLLHTMLTAARHYNKFRELVSKQESVDQARDGGAIFYLLDVSEQIEGCASALHRVCMAAKRMTGRLGRLEQMGFESLSHLSKANALDIVSQASAIVGSNCWKNSPQARAAIQAAIALAQSYHA